MSADESQNNDDNSPNKRHARDSQPTTHYNVNQYFQNIHYNDVEKVVDAVHTALEEGGLEPFNDDDIEVEENSLSAAEAAVAAYHAQQREQNANSHDTDNRVQERQNQQENHDSKRRKVSQLEDVEHETVAQIAEAVVKAASHFDKVNEGKDEDKDDDSDNNNHNRDGIKSSADATSDSNLIDASSSPYFNFMNLPEGADPKKICRFCGKTFAHAGSLGRHLDSRKGTPMHPLEAIEQIRANVYRRGDPEAIKARRSERSRNYNRRDYVKEKNRQRRRVQSKVYRVKENYLYKFLKRVSYPTLPTHPSFPRMVLFFLPPAMWPHDPPTFQTFETLLNWLETPEISEKVNLLNGSFNSESYMEKLNTAYENWLTLSGDTKKDLWIREQRVCAQEALGGLTLFDFAVRKDYANSMANVRKLELTDMKLIKTQEQQEEDREDNENVENGFFSDSEQSGDGDGDHGDNDSVIQNDLQKNNLDNEADTTDSTNAALAAVAAAVVMKNEK